MKRGAVPALLAALLSAPVMALDLAGLSLYGESAAARDDGLFALPADERPYAARSAAAELWLRHERGGMVAEWAGRGQGSEGDAPVYQGRLNELYVDFSLGGLDLTLGKKVMGSGIGFGFRPLDVIQREDRRRLMDERLEGVPLLALERIDADSALSLIWLNRLSVDGGLERAPHEAVLRHYRLWGELETHTLIHLHEHYGPAPGAGFSWVHGEGLALHGALLWQARFPRPAFDDRTLLAVDDPWYMEEGREDGRLLLGLSWTGESGYTLLAEAWHDGAALSDADWRALRTRAAAQRALLGLAPEPAVYGNLAWDLRAYQSVSLMQDNLLLRLSHDGERTDPFLDLLFTPADGGWVATAGFDQELHQGLSLRGGLRGSGGPGGSAYGQLPTRNLLFLELRAEVVR